MFPNPDSLIEYPSGQFGVLVLANVLLMQNLIRLLYRVDNEKIFYFAIRLLIGRLIG